MTLPIEMKRLLVGCNTKDEFETKFRQTFKEYCDKTPIYNVYMRINNLWYGRERHLDELRDIDNTVMVPKTIMKKTDMIKQKDDSVPDIGVLMVKQNHLLEENNELLKEIVGLLKKTHLDNQIKPSDLVSSRYPIQIPIPPFRGSAK